MSATELETVLQQLFMECDATMSVSTSYSTISIGDELPIFKIVQYIQNELPSWSTDDLAEFWKCLAAVSSNGCVNLWQFKEAIKCWIAKIQEVQSSQDDNNNAREKLYLVSDTDSSMKDMDINRDIVELELRMKLRELHEENILLRDELERHEASIDNLRHQCNVAERQLDRYVQKCQQFEKENDEQREQLNEAIKKGKAMALTLQRCTKEEQNLSKQLEAAEIEVQTIPSLKCKMEKINKEKMDCMKQIARLQEKFDETEDECKQLKITITELEEISIKMKETYDQMIFNLREKNCQLAEENTELQSSIFSRHSAGERLSISSLPDTDGYCTHSTPYKSGKILPQDSLYMELKASGFAVDCNKCDLYKQELDEYDAAISTVSDQLEKVVQIFNKTWSSIDDVPEFSSQDMDTNTNIETLRYKATILLNIATEKIATKSTKDSSTQLRTDPANGLNDLDQFGIVDFRDLIRTYRSVHTLPSQSSQLPSSTAKNSNQRVSSCQRSRTDSPDASFARGDCCITQKNCDEKSFAMESLDVSDQRNHTPNRSSEMPKVSNAPQMDSTTLTSTSEEEKTSTKVVRETRGASSNPTSPRRKISVYYRSFDVATVEDSLKDRQSSSLNPEVKRSSSNPGDSFERIDEKLDPKIVAEDQNNTFKYSFNYNYRNAKDNSDSSSASSPLKQFKDSILEDISPIKQPILGEVRLAPTRLKLPQEIKKKLNETVYASSDSVEPNISKFPLSSVVDDKREKDDDALRSSATFVIDKCEMEIKDEERKSKPYSTNKIFLPQCTASARCLFPYNHTDSRKIADSENPHSQTSVQRVESKSRVERSVDGQMSSRENSSDSECEPAAESSDRGIAEKVDSAVSSLNDSATAKIVPCKNVAQKNPKPYDRNQLNAKQEKRQRLLFARRSFSESESSNRSKCRCKHQKSAPLIPEGNQCRVFPSLTNVRLQESGIANLSDTGSRENLSELELQDTIRQRNSVSGRMTGRRLSFNYESPKWEIEKLDRTDSSSSISELHGIFEQAESRRSSKEENNNMLRLSHSNNQNMVNSGINDNEIWTNAKQQTFEFVTADEDINLDTKSYTRASQSFLRSIPWRMILWGITFFFLGFFVNQVMVNACNGPLHGWSIEHILSRYIYKLANAVPHPM